ncbi:MAG: GNAT family N-acetyltransferase [Deltaproteobacteria bacterium]|nr:GNAT family N-acetyltransferase [Deltaproteobacteria bacterium]
MTIVPVDSHTRLRPLALGDEPSLARQGDDFDIARWMRDRFPHPYTRESAESWVQFNLDVVPVCNFAIEVDGELVGCAGILLGDDIHRASCEIGYWLGRTHWGKGTATRVVRALTQHAMDGLRLERVFASVFEGNVASCRVLEKSGFRHEGVMRRSVLKNGVHLDSHLYARVVGDP